MTNTGTIEATAGGTLNLIATVTNTGGTIKATGASSVVEFNGSTITGGTLTTSGGGTVQNSGTATLNGVSVSNGSTVTAVNGSSTTLQGTITINPTGTLAQSSTGSFTDLHISGTVELAGGGTLAMSNNFNNRIFATGSDTLINDASNTIQGSGQFGINNGGFAFNLNNKGTINANQSAALQVAPNNTVTNTGTLEATTGGTLNLTGGTFNNTGGLILATGSGSAVDFSGSTISGGTLTTSSGGTIQNSNTATLDGSTNTPTISSGSTVTLLNGTSTTLMGTIINNGTLAQNSTGSFTDLHISGKVTLSGSGSLTLSNNFNNRIFASGSDSLVNDVNHTIQGSGQFGINNGGFGFQFTNNGTVIADQSTQLQIAPGSTTNNGTFQVASGSLMNVIGTFTNFSTDTLTGGTYIVAGTLQFPGANIVNNAANITLTGAASTIVNESSVNGIDNIFTSNLAAGTFTIQNGRNFTSAPSFSNAGAVNIGAGTTFIAASGYTQSGGSTQVDGTLSSPGVTVNGGLLKGTGTVTGNVTVGTGAGPGAVISPGDSPGTLTIQNALALNSDATYKFELNSSTVVADKIVANGVTINGAKFSFTDLGGGALALGASFVIIDYTAGSPINGVFSNLVDNSTFTSNGNTYRVSYEGGTGNDLTLSVIPEPGAIALIFLGCGVLLGGRMRRD